MVDQNRPAFQTSPESEKGPWFVRPDHLGPFGTVHDVIAPNGKVRTCHGGGKDDGLQAAINHAADLNAAWQEIGGPLLLTVLRDVEWSGPPAQVDLQGSVCPSCPRCGGLETVGHKDECALAEALRRAKGGAA